MADPNKIIKDLKRNKIDVSLLSDEASPCVVNEWVSTGCLPLDRIIGNGLPVGRITEIFGDNSTGKSLIAAQVAAVGQQNGHIVVYADTETTVSMDIMKAVGVDTESLIYAAPDTVEEVFDLFDKCIASKKLHYPDDVMIIIWDSIAATSIEMEMEAEYGKSMYGTHARLISQALRKITRQLSKERICAVFLNQTREKIGVMYGDKVATFGGKAVGFHSSVRIQLKLAGKIRDANKKIIGVETRASIIKNKVAAPFQEAILPIYFGFGIDDAGATLHWLQDNNFIIKDHSNKNKMEFQGVGFTRKEWGDIFKDNYDLISDLMYNTKPTSDDIEVEAVDGE